MNALEIADMLAGTSSDFIGAAGMLRRQHEAIKQLREACQQVFDQWGECQATKKCRKALADTENL